MDRPTDPGTSSSRPLLVGVEFWRNLGLGLGILLTGATGLVVGWFNLYFHFFGESADAEDYAVATGAYAAAAAALLLGALATWAWTAPRWQLVLALLSAGLLAIFALDAAASISSAEPGSGINSWPDGAGGVLVCPWTWPLVVLGIWGPLRGRRAGTKLPVGAE